MCGYLLTETNPEQVMFIAWGAGKNGKSTTFNILSKMLGDYSTTAKAESFMKTGTANDARNDLACLQRKRIVITSEPPAGGKLNETLIKSATGTDKIKARFLYQEFIEFTPAFKIILHTNHRPRITESDEGIWRRLKMFPFDHVFTDEERDLKIEEKMMKEASGIFNWMVQGYRKYYDSDFGGLKESPVMKQAVAEYRTFEDILQTYITDRCIKSPEQSISKRDLYSDFISWCETSGEETVSIKKFSSMIGDRFSASIKETFIDHVRSWKGLGLKEQGNTPMEKLRTKAKQSRLK
jgi:putative DNA primase/helicase